MAKEFLVIKASHPVRHENKRIKLILYRVYEKINLKSIIMSLNHLMVKNNILYLNYITKLKTGLMEP